MTTYVVTRHEGAVQWLKNHGHLQQGDEPVVISHWTAEHLAALGEGGVVIGILPMAIAADVCAKGGRYLSLNVQVPPELRGAELTAQIMDDLGAWVEEFKVIRP